jgi:hypothetical protein
MPWKSCPQNLPPGYEIQIKGIGLWEAHFFDQ